MPPVTSETMSEAGSEEDERRSSLAEARTLLVSYLLIESR